MEGKYVKKPIKVYDLFTKQTKYFLYARDAARVLDVSPALITRAKKNGTLLMCRFEISDITIDDYIKAQSET